MKVYVASGSDEREFAAEYMRRLKAAGIELTLDWTEEIAKNGGFANRGLTEKQRLDAARADVSAVEDADLFWLLLPNGASRGCWFEFGIAHECGSDIIVSGDIDQSIFTSLANVQFRNHEEAFKHIVKQAERK